MKLLRFNMLLVTLTVMFSAASFIVVWQGASDEPYFVFRQSDAIVQVGVAMVLMFLWIQLALGILVGVVRRRVSRWWLPLLLWIFICEFFLCQSPKGYVEDITRYVAQSH